jgi:Cu(I)/Ag(I) efflux system membrane fusion protein
MEVYTEEALADQREYLEMLMEIRKMAAGEQKIFDAQYGTNAERVSLVGMSYEHKNMNARLGAIQDRLARIGMTPEDFRMLELGGKVRSTFIIKAPQAGTLLGALPHVGERFTTETVLFRLVPLNDVWFVAEVYEQDLSLLQLGQEIAIQSKSSPGKVFKGKLVFMGKEVDPKKRTVKVRFLVPNPDGALLPQLSATGTLGVGNQKPQLAVPVSAVIDTGSRQLVYVETSPGTYAMRIVKVGAEGELQGDGSSRWVPVIEGVTAGESVVTSGAFLIDAEAQLRGLPGSGAETPPVKP